MKRKSIRALVLVAVCVATAWLVYSKVSASTARGEAGAGGSSSAALVTTHAVEPETLYDTLGMVGTMRADESITVRNEVGGKVVSLDFQEGERVERGDRLLQMRADVLRAELRAQQRRRDMLQTEIDRLEQVLDQGGVT